MWRRRAARSSGSSLFTGPPRPSPPWGGCWRAGGPWGLCCSCAEQVSCACSWLAYAGHSARHRGHEPQQNTVTHLDSHSLLCNRYGDVVAVTVVEALVSAVFMLLAIMIFG